jgi:hypothetical protein
MSSAKIKQLTFEHEHEKPLSILIIELLQNSEGGRWQGTAADLVSALHLPEEFSARSLSVRVKNACAELERAGVQQKYVKKRGLHLIRLSLAYAVSKHERITYTTNYKRGCSKTFDESTPVRFPFDWRYGKIVELSETEKIEVNTSITNGTRKHHFRHCQLCSKGGEGVIQYRKTSDGNASLLCKECAEKYVRNAKELKKRGV